MQTIDDERRLRFTQRHSMLSAVPGVFVGGMIGSSVCAALSLAWPASWSWPWITCSVNMLGSLLLGHLLEYLA